MKKVYVIYKQGIYGHGIHGIFTSRTDAENMADVIAAKDKNMGGLSMRKGNNYHDWCVYKVPMNTVCSAKEREEEGFTDEITKKNLVYIVKGTR